MSCEAHEEGEPWAGRRNPEHPEGLAIDVEIAAPEIADADGYWIEAGAGGAVGGPASPQGHQPERDPSNCVGGQGVSIHNVLPS